MGAIWASFIAVLKSLPWLLQLLQTSVEAINKAADYFRKSKKEEEARIAAELSKVKKDTSGLEKLFDPTRKPNAVSEVKKDA